VGAPVDRNESCVPSVTIFFTVDPPATLQSVAKAQPWLVPGLDMIRNRARQAQPIQAWYATGIRDARGRYTTDSGRDRGVSTSANTAKVTGFRLTDGQHTIIHHVLIVIDPAKLPVQEIVPLSDYIAVLALAQIGSLDDCRPLPSIANMPAPACDRKTNSITANDLAYLHGLYKMPSDRLQLAIQKNDIADGMAQALGTR